MTIELGTRLQPGRPTLAPGPDRDWRDECISGCPRSGTGIARPISPRRWRGKPASSSEPGSHGVAEGPAGHPPWNALGPREPPAESLPARAGGQLQRRMPAARRRSGDEAESESRFAGPGRRCPGPRGGRWIGVGRSTRHAVGLETGPDRQIEPPPPSEPTGMASLGGPRAMREPSIADTPRAHPPAWSVSHRRRTDRIRSISSSVRTRPRGMPCHFSRQPRQQVAVACWPTKIG